MGKVRLELGTGLQKVRNNPTTEKTADECIPGNAAKWTLVF